MQAAEHGRPWARWVFIMTLVTVLLASIAAHAQCVDSSEVTGFKVRSVKVKTLFGRVPRNLQHQLDSHRGETYSSDRASQYINEIRTFYASDPLQEKYERLIANKLKLSVKAGRTWLECVEPIKSDDCPRCVDVTIKRYFLDIDALDSSPYLLLFPRSALAAFYGAIPRPLLALNPGFKAAQDKRAGAAMSVDTATDLLDLKSVFSGEADSDAASGSTPTPGAAVARPADSPGDVEITFPTPGFTATNGPVEEPSLELQSRDTKLLLRLRGWKGVSKDFYDTSSSLTLERTNARGLLQSLALDARVDARKLPLGKGSAYRNALLAGFDADLRLHSLGIKVLSVGGKYRWSRNRLFTGDIRVPGEMSTDNGFEVRMITDGALAGGLTRTGLWFDGASRNPSGTSYKRAAVEFGYGKEFAIARKKDFHQIAPPELDEPCWTSMPDPKKPDEVIKNESTFGVELLLGAGRAWGITPEYSRFYGGGPRGQFLYDELTAQDLISFPAGPIIRGLGQSEGGALVGGNVERGGTSFWHANLSVSIPVPAWTRPLIPHEWVTFSPKHAGDEEFDGHAPEGANICRDLKSTVKTLVGVSGVNLMINQQSRDQLTDQQKRDLRLRNVDPRTPEEQARLDTAEQALAAAKLRVRPEIEALFHNEILPITDFIADHANIIAVKPLLMFDGAHLGLRRARYDSTRYGVGGGLQIDVVLARFEFGYMSLVHRVEGDPKGNFVGRLVLKRFF